MFIIAWQHHQLFHNNSLTGCLVAAWRTDRNLVEIKNKNYFVKLFPFLSFMSFSVYFLDCVVNTLLFHLAAET